MSDISRIHGPLPPALDAALRHQRQTTPPAAAGRGGDRVEFSSAARLLGQTAGPENVRQSLIDQVRAEIAAGTYETPEKLDAAIDALAADLSDG